MHPSVDARIVRDRRSTFLAALVVSVCLASFVYRVFVFAPETVDTVGTTIELYEAIASGLPPGEELGFIAPANASDALAGGVHAMAQHALAPRVVHVDLSLVSLVVSIPNAGPELDGDPRLSAFDFVRTAAGRIRVYRRRS